MPSSRIAQRAAALKPTTVNSILQEVRQLQADGKDVVSLMRGQPDLPTPLTIIAAAETALRTGRTHYPNNLGEPRLRSAVADKMRRTADLEYDPETEILVTSGATLGIYAALAATLNPGEEVLLPEPIYDAYHGVIQQLGGIVRPVAARLQAGRFTLDAEAVAAACSPRTRVLLLNTPWNPTGVVLRRQELAELTEIAEHRKLTIISDEIYEQLLYDDAEHVSPASLSTSARDRTIVVNSLSKTYAMTGWRVGYCCGPPDLLRAMYLVLQQCSRGPATFVQDAAVAALTGGDECIAEMRSEFARRRDEVAAVLSDLPGVELLLPEAGFFALADVRDLSPDSEAVRRRLLTEHGVVVVAGASYGAAAEGMLRVSFASGGDTLTRGLERLRVGLRGFR